MSSCAASCCICSPKVSCASGTSASLPTANVPPPCHFASNCSARHRKPSKRSLPPVRVICGLAPSVVGRCRCIESARTHRARTGALPPRASDTTLRLIRHWKSVEASLSPFHQVVCLLRHTENSTGTNPRPRLVNSKRAHLFFKACRVFLTERSDDIGIQKKTLLG